jgi:hypothetical protein
MGACPKEIFNNKLRRISSIVRKTWARDNAANPPLEKTLKTSLLKLETHHLTPMKSPPNAKDVLRCLYHRMMNP